MKRIRLSQSVFAALVGVSTAFVVATLLAASLVATPSASAAPSDQSSQGIVPGVLLIRPRAGMHVAAVARGAGAAVAGTISPLGVSRLKVPAGQEQAIAQRLERAGAVAFAEPEHVYHALVVPNDPYYFAQWGLQKVNGPDAWGITTGDPTTIVAVIDTGDDLYHPDHPAHLLAAPVFLSQPDPSCGAPPSLPIDDYGHGTHVAGIIAAGFNNGIGVASLAPGVNLGVIKAGDCTGSLTDYDIANAIIFAADHGARVINMSFGGSDYSDTLAEAVQYAWSKGVVLVAAAGNGAQDGQVNPEYPAGLPNVLAVSATGQSDNLMSWSGRDYQNGVAAPGSDILSTLPTYANPIGATSYGALSGTSMATPHVAAIAGLIISHYPALTNSQVVQAIELGAASHPVSNCNADGCVRVDAMASLLAAESLAPVPSPRVSSAFHLYVPIVFRPPPSGWTVIY